jgi:threonine synthase
MGQISQVVGRIRQLTGIQRSVKALGGKFDDCQNAMLQILNNANALYQEQMDTLLNLNFQSFKNVKIYSN